LLSVIRKQQKIYEGIPIGGVTVSLIR